MGPFLVTQDLVESYHGVPARGIPAYSCGNQLWGDTDLSLDQVARVKAFATQSRRPGPTLDDAKKRLCDKHPSYVEKWLSGVVEGSQTTHLPREEEELRMEEEKLMEVLVDKSLRDIQITLRPDLHHQTLPASCSAPCRPEDPIKISPQMLNIIANSHRRDRPTFLRQIPMASIPNLGGRKHQAMSTGGPAPRRPRGPQPELEEHSLDVIVTPAHIEWRRTSSEMGKRTRFEMSTARLVADIHSVVAENRLLEERLNQLLEERVRATQMSRKRKRVSSVTETKVPAIDFPSIKSGTDTYASFDMEKEPVDREPSASSSSHRSRYVRTFHRAILLCRAVKDQRVELQAQIATNLGQVFDGSTMGNSLSDMWTRLGPNASEPRNVELWQAGYVVKGTKRPKAWDTEKKYAEVPSMAGTLLERLGDRDGLVKEKEG